MCEDAAEVFSQCKALARAEFRYLDRDGKENRRGECVADEPDLAKAERAMEEKDCDGYLRAYGIIE